MLSGPRQYINLWALCVIKKPKRNQKFSREILGEMRSRRGETFPDNGFEAWGGYMQAKISKLEEQFSAKAAKEENQVSSIFSGVSIFVNGYTNPSADELKSLMSRHGGVYHTYQRSEDYVIASNLPDTKVKNTTLCRVVKPEWITDSLAANKLLDFRDYLLYKNSRNQPKLNFNIANRDSLKEPAITEPTILKIEGNISDFKPNPKSLEIFEAYPVSSDPPGITGNYHDGDITHALASISKNEGTDFKKPELPITKTAADPNFISEFYNNSRLHHISQLGACFKQHINELRESSDFIFPARAKLKENILILNNPNLSPVTFERGKIIMHIDMDCFFVSVGLRNRPELKGKPIAVTHSKGGHPRSKRPGVDRNAEFSLYKQKQVKKLSKTVGIPEENIKLESRVDNITDEDDIYGSMSEIASCSYEARAQGVTNGMFMGAAVRLCPDLRTIPYDFEGYKEVAYTLYNTIAQYTLDIEAVSCDEMYVDCTDLLKDINVSVQDFATVLRNEIRQKTGCLCSTGFGGNRLQARLATKKAKPDGQFFLTADLVEDFMHDIKLSDLPGVGRQTAQKLESLGHETCGSLQDLTLASLKTHLGNKTGTQLFDQCRGRDANPLIFHTVRKSVSAEVNYGIRFENNDQSIIFLKQLSAEVCSRMQQFKVLGKCVTLKLMVRAKNAPVETAKFMGHGFCDVINKSVNLNIATNDADIITKEVIAIFKKLMINPTEMRGVGIQITKLEPINCKSLKGTINIFFPANKTNIENLSNNFKKPEGISNNSNLENIGKLENSPIKRKLVKSPQTKSPILNTVKSPTAKKRGRPPKTLKISTSKNLMSKFLQGKVVVKDTPYKDPMIREITHTEKPTQEPLQNDTSKGLIGLPWDQVRELLRAWLDSGQIPLPCDINMLADYMQEMVINKNIDKLNILLNFLRRRTYEIHSEKWIKTYDYIIGQVQNAMLSVYGKKLWVND